MVVQRQYTSATTAQYDALIARMGMTPGGPHLAAGLLFHFVVQTGDGFLVTYQTARQGRTGARNVRS
jgi:hypothetical protein